MKKENGFTLIELLAVIVILAIIALIAVPVIMSVLNKANKSAFKDTAYGIISAGELYYAEQQLDVDGMQTDKTFSLPSNELDIKGNVPEGTELRVNANGETALAMSNGRYCITKGYDDTDITITEDIEHCYVPYTLRALTTTENDCLTSTEEDACVGELFTITVNAEGDTEDFYVYADDGKELKLIMSENLGTNVAWIDANDYATENNKDTTPNTCSYTSCNDEGPITAINYLDGLTDDEWENLPKKDYTYSGLSNDSQTIIYEDIIRNMRARMITYDEINTIETANNGSLPSYMHGNYWMATPISDSSQPNVAGSVTDSGSIAFIEEVHSPSRVGIRPVIELSK